MAYAQNKVKVQHGKLYNASSYFDCDNGNQTLSQLLQIQLLLVLSSDLDLRLVYSVRLNRRHVRERTFIW